MPSTWIMYDMVHALGVPLKSTSVPLVAILDCIDTWLLSGKGSGIAFVWRWQIPGMLKPKDCACR